MLNQTVLVGRIVDLKEKETSIENTLAIVTIAVPRSWKNMDGEYDVDYIDCILWNEQAKRTLEYCENGDIIGVKGRLQKLTNDKKLSLVAEKVTFLQSKRSES